MCTAGLVTFGLLGFHLVQARLVPTAGVPLLYAGRWRREPSRLCSRARGMTGSGRGSCCSGAWSRWAPPLALGHRLTAVVAGVLVWGAATGVQDSAVKALVADLAPKGRRATAYGVFAGVQGAGALLGGALTGGLYEWSLPVLVATVALVQAVAFVLLVPVVVTGRATG